MGPCGHGNADDAATEAAKQLVLAGEGAYATVLTTTAFGWRLPSTTSLSCDHDGDVVVGLARSPWRSGRRCGLVRGRMHVCVVTETVTAAGPGGLEEGRSVDVAVEKAQARREEASTSRLEKRNGAAGGKHQVSNPAFLDVKNN